MQNMVGKGCGFSQTIPSNTQNIINNTNGTKHVNEDALKQIGFGMFDFGVYDIFRFKCCFRIYN
jgi:hypothetical protein